MNKSELIEKTAERTGASQTSVKEILEALIATTEEALVNGETVFITGFGSLSVVDRAARQSRNPRTGELMSIPACKTPKFRAGKNLKSLVKA